MYDKQIFTKAPIMGDMSVVQIDRLDMAFYDVFDTERVDFTEPAENNAAIHHIITRCGNDGVEVTIEDVLTFAGYWNSRKSRPLVLYNVCTVDEGSVMPIIMECQFPDTMAIGRHIWIPLDTDKIAILISKLEEITPANPMDVHAESLFVELFTEEDVEDTIGQIDANRRYMINHLRDIIANLNPAKEIPFFVGKHQE